jgi:DNA replication protein DnaC
LKNIILTTKEIHLNKDIESQLHQLRLRHLSTHFEPFCQQFGKQSSLAEKVIRAMAEQELEELRKANLERRINQAKVGPITTMDKFDWGWPKKIPRSKVESILTLNFMSEQQNIILMGPEGVGKTMIAKNLAFKAAFQGKRAYFCTAAELVLKLKDAGTNLKNRLNQFIKPDLLVIDEIGYLSFDNKAADLLFRSLVNGMNTAPQW